MVLVGAVDGSFQTFRMHQNTIEETRRQIVNICQITSKILSVFVCSGNCILHCRLFVPSGLKVSGAGRP